MIAVCNAVFRLMMSCCATQIIAIKPRNHRRRSSVKFGGTKFLPEKYVLKSAKFPNFTWFLPEKLSKYSNFYDICLKNLQNSRILHDFCPKNARILHNNSPKKIFFRIFWGHVPPPTPCPVSYACERNCRNFDVFGSPFFLRETGPKFITEFC